MVAVLVKILNIHVESIYYIEVWLIS